MHIKKTVLTAFFFSLAFFFLFSSLTHANTCPNKSPMESQVFKNFKKVLETEYFGKSVSGDEHLFGRYKSWQMIGHALGRLALAVQNQPDRRAAFDCVQLGLEQIIALKGLRHHEEQAFLFRVMMQAGYGMHNEEVNKLLKGGLPTEPLYDVFGGKINTPTDSKDPGGAGGGTTPTTTLKDPVVTGSVSTPGGSSSGGKVASGSSSKGHCSNWMTLSFSDSKGNLDPVETEKACALSEKSGDFITKINSTTKACSVCSKDDWTPPLPPPPPPTVIGGGSGTGGTAGGGSTGGSSGKMKCHLRSGYGSVSKDDTELNVLRATKPNSMGFVEFVYTRARRIPFDKNKPPDFDYDRDIKRAREAAKDIVKNGYHGKQFGFASRVGPDGFCNFIESQCDMTVSSVKLAANYCKW